FTPLYTFLKSALVTVYKSKIVLVYSSSSLERTLFYDELLEWQSRYQYRLHIVFIWSDSTYLKKARMNREYIIELLYQHLTAGVEQLFYTCRPLFYMDLCRFTLLGMGIPDEQIKRETFYFPEEEEDDDEKEEEPVDTSSYDVIIDMYGEKH